MNVLLDANAHLSLLRSPSVFSAFTARSSRSSRLDRSETAFRALPEKPAAKRTEVTIFLARFKVKTTLAGDAVCGGYDGEFDTDVGVTTDELDENGFVVHNELFIEAVRQRFSQGVYKATCEQLALGVVNVAGTELGPRLTKVVARCYNLTGWVEAVWHRGMEMPPFPEEVFPEGAGKLNAANASKVAFS